MFNLDNVSNKKPNQYPKVEAGRHVVTVAKVTLAPSKSSGTEQLTVTFKTTDGKTFNEFFQATDNEFVRWKLKRFLESAGINLAGDVTLKDIAKVIMGKTVEVQTAISDSGYTNVDYSGDSEGFYVPSEPTKEINEVIKEEDIKF